MSRHDTLSSFPAQKSGGSILTIQGPARHSKYSLACWEYLVVHASLNCFQEGGLAMEAPSHDEHDATSDSEPSDFAAVGQRELYGQIGW